MVEKIRLDLRLMLDKVALWSIEADFLALFDAACSVTGQLAIDGRARHMRNLTDFGYFFAQTFQPDYCHLSLHLWMWRVIPFIGERFPLLCAEFKLHLVASLATTASLLSNLFYHFSLHYSLSSIPLMSIHGRESGQTARPIGQQRTRKRALR